MKLNDKRIILEERTDQLIIRDLDGRIDSVPKTEFFMLKYKEFNGERIYYQFDKNSYVQETYDIGIFNCILNGVRMQLRNSERIAFAINWHKHSNAKSLLLRMKPFQELFTKNFVKNIQLGVLKSILKAFEDRIKYRKDGIEIDQRFFVDKNAQAFFKNNNKWDDLCIVAKGYLHDFDIESEMGNIEINSKSLEIVAKVMFLLEPDMKDKIFTGQIQKANPDLFEHLKRDQLSS